MSVDLERQLAAYGEHLETLAASAAPDSATVPPTDSRRTYRRGLAIAVASAAIVLLIVGSIALLAPFSGEETTPITDAPTPSTVPETTMPIAPFPGVSAPSAINEVVDLALAPNGAIWAATRGGVVRWDEGASVPVVFGEADGLPAAETNEITVAADGTVWAAGREWISYFDQTWHSVEADEVWIDELTADPVGRIWTAGIDTLHHIDRDETDQVSLPRGLGMSGGVDFAVDTAGRVLVLDRISEGAHVVHVYDGGSWRELATWSPGYAFSRIVSNIEVARDGTVWVSTASDGGSPAPGVASFAGGEWTTYTTADGLASDAGAVVAAPDGTVWMIHRDAVSRFDGDNWTPFDVEGSARSGVGGSDGTLWLATDNGIVHFGGNTTARQVVPDEMTPVPGSFSLEPGAVAPSVDAGSFGEVAWQKFDVPVGHSLTGGIATPYGYAATGSTSVRTSTDGVTWTTSEPPLDVRHLVASGEDLYSLAGDTGVRLAWTGTTWRAVDELTIPEPGPEIRAEGGYLDFAERMAFGQDVTVMTARSRVFFSLDGHTFVPALRGPDAELLEGAGAACHASWGESGGGEGSIGPVFATGNGFVAITAGHGGDWDNHPMCRPVIWTSSDGSAWDLVSVESPFGPDAYVNAMAERDGHIVAVGGRGSLDQDEAVLWESADGWTWNEVPDERITGAIEGPPWAIAAGEAGWVALYGEAGTHEGVRAMYSLDGVNWVVVDDDLPDFWWAFGTPDVAVGTDRILVTYYNGVAVIGEINR